MTLSPFKARALAHANERVAQVWTDERWTDRARVDHFRAMERQALLNAGNERAGSAHMGPDPDWADVYERVAQTYRRAIDGIRATDPDTGAARVNAGVRLAWTDGAAWVHA